MVAFYRMQPSQGICQICCLRQVIQVVVLLLQRMHKQCYLQYEGLHNMWLQESWLIGLSSKISPYPLGYMHTILRLLFPYFFVLVSSIALVFPKHILLGNRYIASSNLCLHTFQSNGLIVCWSIFLMRLPSHLLERPQFVD